ncbi:MAG: methyltransferase domain-containing protein [Bacteroidota bacterium]
MSAPEDLVRSNAAAWDRAAQKYAPDVERDVAFLQGGGNALFEIERRALGDLSACRRAIHLQCSHGLDALSLLDLGVTEVVGVDISPEMLAQAEQKASRLGARAEWVCADVLGVPSALDGSAQLVYTGKGALPWIHDLDAWAAVVRRLLQPGGRLFVFEGHPLNWVWAMDEATHRLHADGRGYFDREPLANDGFPAAAVEQFTPEGVPAATAWEWQWTLGDVVTAVARAGFVVERLEEHPEHFWPQFDEIGEAELGRLPHTFSLLARLPSDAVPAV